jgi:hypothetical protein
MSVSIIKHLEDYLGAHIEKINPNTQAVNASTRHHQYDLLAQASVPAVLVVLYKYTRASQGAETLATQLKLPPLELMLGNMKNEVVQRVATYAGISADQADRVMDEVADESIRFVWNKLGSTRNAENIQAYFTSQKQSIFTRLPEDLQMGELLHDNTVDDRTNKMEGPISGLAQSLSKLFTATTNKKDKGL